MDESKPVELKETEATGVSFEFDDEAKENYTISWKGNLTRYDVMRLVHSGLVSILRDFGLEAAERGDAEFHESMGHAMAKVMEAWGHILGYLTRNDWADPPKEGELTIEDLTKVVNF